MSDDMAPADILRIEIRRWRNSKLYRMCLKRWPDTTPLRAHQLEATAIRHSLMQGGAHWDVIKAVLKLHAASAPPPRTSSARGGSGNG